MKMRNDQERNDILDNLLTSALEAYQQSTEFECARHQREEIEALLENNLVADDRAFVEAVLFDFGTITDKETEVAYRQGFSDCIWVLKQSGLVA